VSSPDDSSRLNETLERLLGGPTEPSGPGDEQEVPAPARPAAGDADGDEPYQLPEIVPATADVPSQGADPAAVAPALPARDFRPTLPHQRSSAASNDAMGTRATAATTPAPTPSVAAPTSSQPVAATAAATSWTDHVAPSTGGGSQLRAPGRRPRVRRVTRVLRHIDPWSTFKIALLFSGVAYLVALTSGVLLWRVADSTGTLDNVERWFTQFGWETFELQGGEIFRNAWIIGLFGVVFATGGAVLLVTLFNLVSDIVGGVRVTVLEEEVVERTASSRRRYIVRSGADLAAATGASVPTWSVDDDAADSPATNTDVPRTAAPDDERTTRDAPPVEQPGTERTSRSPSAVPADADWSVD
jgi:hypothetical protein